MDDRIEELIEKINKTWEDRYNYNNEIILRETLFVLKETLEIIREMRKEKEK